MKFKMEKESLLEEMRQEAAQWRSRAEKAEHELQTERKQSALRRAISQDSDIVDVDAVATLIANEVVYESGRVNGVREALAVLKTARPYLTYSGNPKARELAGRTPTNRTDEVPELEQARKVFGPTSSGAFALRLKKTSPASYARLKAVAQENGIL